MSDELDIDREFADLCNDLSAEEFRLLEQSIIDDGCREPIVIWANHGDTILDGHNRYKICRKHDRPFKTKSLNLATREKCIEWILKNQLARRNCDASQRAMLAAKLVTSTHGGNRKADQAANVAACYASSEVAIQDSNGASCSTQSDAAETFNVSERSIRSAAKVLEGSKDLQRAVESGDVPVSVAAAVADLPKAEQRKVVAKGPKAVKAKAKEITAAKKHKDKFDTAQLDKDLAKAKKPGSVKKQWEDATVISAIGQFAKQIDAAHKGFLLLFEECRANAGGSQADFDRATRAAHQFKAKSHELLDGVTKGFRMWRPEK